MPLVPSLGFFFTLFYLVFEVKGSLCILEEGTHNHSKYYWSSLVMHGITHIILLSYVAYINS